MFGPETQRARVFVIADQAQMQHIVSSLHGQTQRYEDIYHFIKVFVLSKKKGRRVSTDMESNKRPVQDSCLCAFVDIGEALTYSLFLSVSSQSARRTS